MNVIGIDASLICTAVVVNDKKFVYAAKHAAYTDTGNMKKWFTECEELVTFRFFDGATLKDDHTESEVSKMILHDSVSREIISDILENIDITLATAIGMEGYSYSSAAGPLIDLVSFGSLLRHKLFRDVSPYIEIIPPSQLKLKAAQLTYPRIEKGVKKKTYEWRNKEGVSGGSFKKHEMFKALTENESLGCEWVNYLRESQDRVMGQKQVPKPMEDINDAKLIYEILKAG